MPSKVSSRTTAPDRDGENAAAALDVLAGMAQAIVKAHGTLERRNAALTEQVDELSEQLTATQARAEAETQRMRETHARDMSGLQARLTTAEEKLRKIQGTLA